MAGKTTVVWHGPDALTEMLTPIADLILLPDNARRGDVGAISVSLDRLGQQKPVVVDGDMVILAGNHVTQAAQALGWTHVAAVTSDLAGTDKTRFVLADNRLADLADYDNDLLISQLRALDELDGTGFDYDDLDDLVAYSQEDFYPPDYEGTANTPSIQEREVAREQARATGNEVRSLVFLLTGDQYRYAVEALTDVEAANHTEAFLQLIADHTGKDYPE